MINGLTLLVLIAVYAVYKIGCWIGEAPVIEDAPLSRLDVLDGVGSRGEHDA